MILRRCKHCNNAFTPTKLKGRAGLLCRPCVMDCDIAYDKVVDYLRAHPNVLTTDLSEKLDIPSAFIYALIQEGVFDGKMTAVARCTKCHRDLNATEKEMCMPCKERLAHLVQVSGVKSKVRERHLRESRHRTDGDDNQYGLGR